MWRCICAVFRQLPTDIQKRRRCLFLSPILASKALALPTPHRIDNAVSPRQYELYKRMYIETHHADASVVICLLWCSEFARFLMHNDRRSACADFSHDSASQSRLFAFAARKVRKRLSHIYDRPPPTCGQTERCRKINDYSEYCKKKVIGRDKCLTFFMFQVHNFNTFTLILSLRVKAPTSGQAVRCRPCRAWNPTGRHRR